MSYQGNDVPDNDTQEPSSNQRAMVRIDAISVVAGLLFIAIAALAVTDRFWAEIDPVLMVGGAVIAVGVAMAAGVVRRALARRD